MRYVVPYSAPGVKRGQLRIDAESSAEAIAKALEIHAGAVTLHGPAWRTPSMRLTLRKRERSQIVYGEPVAQVAESAA